MRKWKYGNNSNSKEFSLQAKKILIEWLVELAKLPYHKRRK